MLLTFELGSGSGTEMCASLTANSDNLVEFEEDFTLTLNQETSGASLSLGNAATAITITDSDSM